MVIHTTVMRLQRTLTALGGTECEEKITGLSKCAVVLRLLDHEELCNFLRVYFLLSFCQWVWSSPPPPCTGSHPHTYHQDPLTPLLRICLAFKVKHSRVPLEKTGIVSFCLSSSPAMGKLNKKKERNTFLPHACADTKNSCKQPCSNESW